MEFHVTSDRWRLCKMCFSFPNASELSEISVGKMNLAERIYPMREQTEEPNKPKIHSLEPGEFPSPKCTEFTSVQQSIHILAELYFLNVPLNIKLLLQR